MNKGYLNNGLRPSCRIPFGGIAATSAPRVGSVPAQAEPSQPPLQPLAMAYVPSQKFEALYPADRALQRGTLFAALDLPYCTGGRA